MKYLLAASALALLATGGGSFAQGPREVSPVTDALLKSPPASDWLMYRGNYGGWGYSPLDQIKSDNLGKMRLVWSRVMEAGYSQSTPLVHDGVMYLLNTGDVVQAIDAADGSLIWEFRHPLPERSTLINPLGENKRSAALYEDKVYFYTWDNHIIALDAKTGQLVWEVDRGDGDKGVTNTTGPVIADGVLVAGSSCQFSGMGCYVTGHDAETGKELWRHEFIPRPGEPGDETWMGAPMEARWFTGSWGAYTYDPDLDLVYFGSSGLGPQSEVQRGTPGGSVSGTNTRFAVRPKTGEIIWSHQLLPRDNWDQDCTFEAMVVDSPINPDKNADGMMAVGKVSGETRKVTTGMPCKYGVAWTHDAATGEFLWAKQTVTQNLVAKIDEEGQVTVNEDLILKEPGKTYFQCPSYSGGRDWAPAAYSPLHNVFYVPLNNLCTDVKVRTDEPTPASVHNVELDWKRAPGKERIGRIDAISVETGDTVWSFEMDPWLYSPVLATAGDLLFTGGPDRYFRAISQKTGEELWRTRLNSQVSGHAVSYSVGGKQYVAVSTGGGETAGIQLRLTPDVDGAAGGNSIFVFALED